MENSKFSATAYTLCRCSSLVYSRLHSFSQLRILNIGECEWNKFELYEHANFVTYYFSFFFRCQIPECDDVQHPQFEVEWMQNAIPFKNSKLMKCHRYEPMKLVNASDQQYCEKDVFNQSSIVRCDQNGLIYKTDEVSIVNSVSSLIMNESRPRVFHWFILWNIWLNTNFINSNAVQLDMWRKRKVDLDGRHVQSNGSSSFLANNEPSFRSVWYNFCSLRKHKILSCPLNYNQIIFYRFGAKAVVLYGTILACASGLLQSYSVNYIMFVVCEFMCVAMTCTLFPTSMILAMEWAEVEHRSIVSAFITIFDGFGGVVCGLIAAYSRDFRLFLRLIYAVTLILISLLLLGSESFRWLLANGKQKRIEKLLAKAAKINKRELSPQTMEIIKRRCGQTNNKLLKEKEINQEKDNENSLKALFTCTPLVIRFFLSVFVWIGTAFVTYGIHVISVSLGGDKYTSFILIVLGGFPSPFIMIYLLKHIGRRTCISIGLISSSACILIGKLVPSDYTVISMAMFLGSKCMSKLAFLVLYVHTSELWPTANRHILMGLTSTCGRVGSLLAPLTPLLVRVPFGL